VNEAAAIRRWAAAAGIAGPVGFLAIAFVLAVVRHNLVAAQGWASWPSSMALGGAPGIPMILAFLWLAGCYTVFSFGALRPGLRHPAAWIGFLAVAAGDTLLAFPTDAPGTATTWHGTLHLAGVVLVTVATLIAATGVTLATLHRPAWRAWRATLPVPFLAAAVGAAAGFDTGWAKVVYVVGITLPAAVVGGLLLREVLTGARSG
jgi:hypothetical protein